MIHYMTSEGLGSPWVGNEIRVVTQAGVPVALHCLRAPAKINFDSAWARDLQSSATTLYPPPALDLVLSNALAPLRFGKRWLGALTSALFGERESLSVRIKALGHFCIACQWATRVRTQRVSHIHAQWAFSSCTVAMYGAMLLGVPFSFTGHAVDLTRQRCALREKIRRASFLIAISNWHKQFYIQQDSAGAARTPDLAEKIHVAYCGIYTDEMRPRQGARPPGPFTILSAGRLIEKKGFAHLLRACAILRDEGRDFRCIIAGSGPLEAELRALIAQLRLEGIVSMTGTALQQERIPAFMHTGDCFALACVEAKDGDIDGLPQLTMEAMGCGLPAVTTNLVGNPDLVQHERTGLLVEPADDAGLARALARLMDDAPLRERLAHAGREHVLRVFDIRTSLTPLIDAFRAALGHEAAPPAPRCAGAAHSAPAHAGAGA